MTLSDSVQHPCHSRSLSSGVIRLACKKLYSISPIVEDFYVLDSQVHAVIAAFHLRSQRGLRPNVGQPNYWGDALIRAYA